jgi:hypothetical protein
MGHPFSKPAGGEEQMTEDDKPGRPGTMQTEVTQRKPRGRLGRDVQSKIGQQLRAMYDDVVNAGVPDRFVEMLQKLDNQKDESEKDKGSAA